MTDQSMPHTPRQRIVRIRRRYNRWVGNQVLEDFALRFTATQARRWSHARVANTALGAISFLALEAIGGTITLSYGFDNAVAAILSVAGLIFLTGLPICYYAVRYGVDIDLLTRGAGFGYIGSTVTSLIYASFTFIFFALEAVILATALEMCFGIPMMLGYIIGSLVVIPLVTHGITLISRFQVWTQPLWLGLHIAPFAYLAVAEPGSFADWSAFAGARDPDGGPGFNLLMYGAATTVAASLIAQIGEQVDFLRFLPRRNDSRPLGWWAALIAAGPGWIIPGSLKMLAGSYLAWLVVSHGMPADKAAEPTTMYLAAFQAMVPSPGVAVGLTGIFVIISQLKINVTNAYAGSIAWSNFFSRLTHSHPGRVVWLVFNVMIALLLMVFGVYAALEQILGLYSIIAISWVGAIVADLVINKPLGLSPRRIEFKRAHLYDINPVGLGAMLLAATVAVTAHFGLLGPLAQAFTAFVALGVALVAAPLIAWATRGRFYIARTSTLPPPVAGMLRCHVCENEFESEDMAHCPAYGSCICSLCCSLDARCQDRCKPRARMHEQLLTLLEHTLPAWLSERLTSRLSIYATAFVATALVVGTILTLIYFQATSHLTVHREVIRNMFWMIFLVMALIAGIASLLVVLTQESRRVALEETERQSALLMHEISAHERTDAKLQQAKEAAEAANLAKSRYLVGISHELRAPLNAIFGYAQLLERDRSLPTHCHAAVEVIRQSSQHVSGLIDGLLDISRIEAGHLTLERNEMPLIAVLDQFAGMFRLQAAAKGLGFEYHCPPNLPAVIYADEKRFRQVLFNLLSNAVKFTEKGHVALRVHMRSEIAEFEVSDTGMGITAQDLPRIFEPFERGSRPEAHRTMGMGLGLTITKLLTEIMGGEVTVTSTPGVGSRFRVKMFLSRVLNPEPRPLPRRQPCGYAGERRSVLVVDDDPTHRDLIADTLAPLDFIVFRAADGRECQRVVSQIRPDLILLDISMPDANGWDLAEDLRRNHHVATPIMMISANVLEYRPGGGLEDVHDDFLLKPVDIALLLERIGDLLKIDWIYDASPTPDPQGGADTVALLRRLPDAALDRLIELGGIGHVRGIADALDDIATQIPEADAAIAHLRDLLSGFAMKAFMATLHSARAAEARHD